MLHNDRTALNFHLACTPVIAAVWKNCEIVEAVFSQLNLNEVSMLPACSETAFAAYKRRKCLWGRENMLLIGEVLLIAEVLISEVLLMLFNRTLAGNGQM